MQIEWATPTIARMKILITNDGGVDNPGKWVLVNAVKDLGEVTVVGPAGNQSGVGTAPSMRKSVQIISASIPANTSRALFISGTMGAAIQVAGKGIKAYAFSMDAMDDINNITLGKAITEIVQQLLNPDTPRGRFST